MILLSIRNKIDSESDLISEIDDILREIYE
jgi:hypothetical protein